MTGELQVYWDSCCWIGLINQENRWLGDLRTVFDSAVRGDAQLWISTITILEVVKVPSEDGMPRPWPDANIAQVDNLFLQDYVRTVQLDQQAFRRTHALYRKRYGIEPPARVWSHMGESGGGCSSEPSPPPLSTSSTSPNICVRSYGSAGSTPATLNQFIPSS